MLFSIIVPVYNAQATLDQCVKSVLNQNFRDFELVLVDDGSRDDSPRMCDEYAKDDYRVVVVHQKNGGVSCARNTGIRAAHGDYLVYLDNDDYFLDNALAMIAEQITLKPDADLLVWHMRQLRRQVLEEENGAFPDTTQCCMKGDQAFHFLYSDNHGVFWQVYRYVAKRRLIVDENLFYNSGVIHEDMDLSPYVVLHAKRVHFCLGSYYVYRAGREGSVTSSVTAARCEDVILVVKRWFERLRSAHLNQDTKDGFKALLSRTLWDYVPEVTRFPVAVQDRLFRLLDENRELLTWVEVPRLSACVKRMLLAFLGTRWSAKSLHLFRSLHKWLVMSHS